MRFRRALLCLLSLCLVLAQTGALAHGISHIVVADPHARVAAPSLQKASADHADEFCIECLAFAQVMGAACDSGVEAAAAVLPALPPVAAAEQRAPAARCVAFRARAPPLLLV
jgi:hypothetical protein